MNAARSWWQASLALGRRWLPASWARRAHGTAAPARVPVRVLGPAQRARIAAHLLALSPDDRYLRFGYAASDAHIRAYVAGLDFGRDAVFGIHNRRLELIAVAHLAFAPAAEGAATRRAEFGVSVARHARGRGYGARLFGHAVVRARNAGVTELVIHALSQNVAMLRIARRAGATVERDGAEAEAYLQLPPADFDSHLQQLVQGGVGALDYDLKFQAQHWRGVLGDVAEVRQGVRAARRGVGQ